jgi:hypothetical protein
MAKEKMMTTISANVKDGNEIVGQLVKEVADHSLEQEWLALQLKALGLSTEVTVHDVEPLVIE